MKYHTEGKFLPDRFDFEPLQCLTLVIRNDDQQVAKKVADDDSSQSTVSGKSGKFRADDPEEQDRIMSAMAMEKVMLNDPMPLEQDPRSFSESSSQSSSTSKCVCGAVSFSITLFLPSPHAFGL